jgi:hypothetical protein
MTALKLSLAVAEGRCRFRDSLKSPLRLPHTCIQDSILAFIEVLRWREQGWGGKIVEVLALRAA